MQQQKKIGILPVIVLIFIILVIIGAAGYFFLNKNSVQQQTSNGVPQAKTIDTAPQVPQAQKTVVTVMESDSTYVKYLVPTNTLATFIHTLPMGTTVISK